MTPRSSSRKRVSPPGPPPGLAIDVVDRQRVLRVGSRWLATVARRAVARQGFESAEICVLVLDDRGIARLHEQWLDISGPTDVITFDMSDDARPGTLHGDIAVSAETARRTARELGWQPRHELAYYVVHGILHLAGYDDHDPADRRAMRARERVLMRAAGLPTPPPTGSRR
jgi:probable rRNA maturation factor